MQKTKPLLAFRIIFVIMLIGIALIGAYALTVPQSISVFAGEELPEQLDIPLISIDPVPLSASSRVSGEEAAGPFCVSLSAETRIMGVIPLKKVNVDVFKDITLYPGGMPFGVKLYTDGVIVAGITGVDTEKGKVFPASDGGLMIGDIINDIDGKPTNTAEEVSAIVEQSGGKKLQFNVTRNSKRLTVEVSPVISKADKTYKAGIWIRDSTAGIGTVTFVVPGSKAFGGLGHGICDVDTGELMPLRKGTVVDVSIRGITKGAIGNPGELQGIFHPGKIGALIGNNACGVYGVMSKEMDVSHSEPLKIGLKDEVKTGAAEIFCTIGEKLERYSAEIVKIGNKNSEQKNFVIKITDKRLLDTTGGIVQGMSGSPIIQNGKLVGAVTHVLVNDPTKGYGIFIENMLKNMPEIIE